MSRVRIRIVPLAALIAAAAAATWALLAGDTDRQASLIATVMASVTLALWPLFAGVLTPAHRPSSRVPVEALLETLLVTSTVSIAVLMFNSPRMAWVMGAALCPMLVIVQLMLGLGANRLLLSAALVGTLLAAVWLGPLAALLGSNSGVPQWIALLSPLSALAAVADCDYLRLMWFYQNSSIGASQFEYPSLSQTLWACGISIVFLYVIALFDVRWRERNTLAPFDNLLQEKIG